MPKFLLLETSHNTRIKAVQYSVFVINAKELLNDKHHNKTVPIYEVYRKVPGLLLLLTASVK
jgi:hypothetical protein